MCISELQHNPDCASCEKAEPYMNRGGRGADDPPPHILADRLPLFQLGGRLNPPYLGRPVTPIPTRRQIKPPPPSYGPGKGPLAGDFEVNAKWSLWGCCVEAIWSLWNTFGIPPLGLEASLACGLFAQLLVICLFGCLKFNSIYSNYLNVHFLFKVVNLFLYIFV